MFLSKATIIVSVAIFGGVQVKAQCPSNDNGQCKYISHVCGYHIDECISNLYISYYIDDIYPTTHFSLSSPITSRSGDYEPVNPYTCGEDSCAYENRCLASAAGFDVDTECCQSPQPSICPMNFDPQICGTLQCSYSNTCVANLAGYSDDQCESPPPECPTGTKDCSGDPANPYTCG